MAAGIAGGNSRELTEQNLFVINSFTSAHSRLYIFKSSGRLTDDWQCILLFLITLLLGIYPCFPGKPCFHLKGYLNDTYFLNEFLPVSHRMEHERTTSCHSWNTLEISLFVFFFIVLLTGLFVNCDVVVVFFFMHQSLFSCIWIKMSRWWIWFLPQM